MFINSDPKRFAPLRWILFSVIGGILIALLTSSLRDPLWNINALLDLVLGSLTNFVHGALLFPFTILTFRDLLLRNSPSAGDEQNLNRWFYTGMLISIVFIVLVEVVQLDGINLIEGIFDPNDVIATLISPLLSVPIFQICKPDYLNRFKG